VTALPDGEIPFFQGQQCAITVKITEADVDRFAELSGDEAPLHTDEAFARTHGFSGKLVHGALLCAGISRLVGMEMPGAKALLERIDIAFRKPVYAPAELNVTAKIRQISEAVSSIVLEISIIDETGSVVATGKTWHRILS
jgi:3-hydroxybutyryl-CoA dehydratase